MENASAGNHDDPFEQSRLKDLEDIHIMDSGKEMCFDLLTQLAAIVCRTPIALLSFINSERQWFKSAIGIDLTELPKYLTPCAQTMKQSGAYYEIQDSHINDPYCAHVEYLKENGLRSYFGVPVYSKQGHSIGSLCVLDFKPRKLDREQIKTLQLISKEITDLIEIRRIYMKNLARLRELDEASYIQDKRIIDQSHKLVRRAMAELSAGLIYQIRPLALTVQTISEELFHLKEGESFHSAALMIRDSGKQITDILDTLEKYLSAEKEKWMKPVDLLETLEFVLTHLEHKIVKNNITIQRNYEMDLRVIGNSSQIVEVLYSLINNAIEAVDQMNERVITITLKEDGRYALIIIQDSGYGIPEDVEPFIFQPFFTTKGSKGTGIGLSLALGHIQNHSGSIRLTKNYNPTTFEVRLPLP